MPLECLDTCPSCFKVKSPVKGVEGMSKDGAKVSSKYGNVLTKDSMIGKGHSDACEAYQTAQIASAYLSALRMHEEGRAGSFYVNEIFFDTFEIKLSLDLTSCTCRTDGEIWV